MLKAGLQVLAGVLLVALVLAGVSKLLELRKRATLPDGWQIISQAGDTNAILIADGVVWTGGRDGVTLIDHASRQPLDPQPAALAGLRLVRAIVQDGQGVIWIAHDRGVSHQGALGWQTLTPSDLQLTGAAMSLLPNPDGTMLIGGAGGLVLMRNGRITPVALPLGSPEAVSALYRDRDGRLWAGSDAPFSGGLLSRGPDGVWQVYQVGRDLVHGSINEVLQAPDGTLWFASGFAGHGGVSLFDGTTWRVLSRDDGLGGRKVRSVLSDHDGRIWLGHEYDGASVAVDGGWARLTAQDGLAGEEVKVMRQDPGGTYWIGTTQGVSVIAPGTWRLPER